MSPDLTRVTVSASLSGSCLVEGPEQKGAYLLADIAGDSQPLPVNIFPTDLDEAAGSGSTSSAAGMRMTGQDKH